MLMTVMIQLCKIKLTNPYNLNISKNIIKSKIQDALGHIRFKLM